ncbi:thymidine phosphorylase family protein [Ramlibacter sp.]|uniref:thymidine phosphorylase family protein n=1 Tax=Ramlibacter sp. TaxID=1917967 RepID=UPI002FC84F87
MNTLSARRLAIDTYQEHVAYMRHDCPVCASEGFEAQSRLQLVAADRSIIATLNVVMDNLLRTDEIGLSEAAWRALGATEGQQVAVTHPPPLTSMRHVRAKVYGHALAPAAMHEVIADVAAGRYSDLHLASFVTACAGDRLDLDETVALTRAMVDVGERLQWPGSPIVDKHCVGGLPGNRTTMIVVPIVAACGLTMPKTSSRAITSPAGTADTMETLAPVDLPLPLLRQVVERTGGCIAWGGAVRLSPADDILIRVERPLDLDSEGQLVASVLSKKLAAGSSHVLIDIPVGATAKVRTEAAARKLGDRMVRVGQAVGLHVSLAITDGSQPVGRGVGPALEAHDVLAVLRRHPAAPEDLAARSVRLAGEILELAGAAAAGTGQARARQVLESGQAWAKFQQICEAQGGLREPGRAPHRHVLTADGSGVVDAVDNRVLARSAKLAGAPKDALAGVEVHVRIGDLVEQGEPVFSLHAQSPGELAYALAYLESVPPVFHIREQE